MSKQGSRLWRWRYIVLTGLLILATISTVQGMRDALVRSQDFQWSGARLLLAHTDPWLEYLRGDPHHQFYLTQFPNYLPVLYVLIAPLGLLPSLPAQMIWVVCNFVLLW